MVLIRTQSEAIMFPTPMEGTSIEMYMVPELKDDAVSTIPAEKMKNLLELGWKPIILCFCSYLTAGPKTAYAAKLLRARNGRDRASR